MENATKALMIAAAVLVVMLIIGLGIGVFNMASEQVDNAGDLSEYQVQQFNDKFRKYEGTNVTGTDANALIKTAFTHNQNQQDATTRVNVDLDGSNIISRNNFDGTQSPAKASPGTRYTVTLTFDGNTGLVTDIDID